MSGLKKNNALLERAAQVMPGAMVGHLSTVSLPEGYPQFFERGEGCHLWDVDGTRYIDFMCAYGPNLFGYRHPKIEAAARAQSERGDVLNGPAPVMVQLAEDLVGMVRHADWAMFCKNGTDATTTAIMIARAHTGKRKILVAHSAYHGATAWCTPLRKGTLPDDRAHIIYYEYNDAGSLAAAVKEAGADLAGIIATPYRHDSFRDNALLDAGYARACRKACDEMDALLIVDDVRGGFRIARDCSWSVVDVEPDISCWGKLLANGHAISAILGSGKAKAAAGSIFVTGSYWYAAVPMAAAVKTLELIRTTDYLERTQAMGARLRSGLDDLSKVHGFSLRQTGPVQMPQIMFDEDPELQIGFAWAQEAVKRGAFFHPWHNMFLCAAVTDADIAEALSIADQAFEAVKHRRGTLTTHPYPAMVLAAVS